MDSCRKWHTAACKVPILTILLLDGEGRGGFLLGFLLLHDLHFTYVEAPES
jgi:hypothetical protein